MFRTSTYPQAAYAPSDWFCPDGLKTFISLARFQADAVTTMLDFQRDAWTQFSLLWDAPFSDLVDELYLASKNEPGLARDADDIGRNEPEPAAERLPLSVNRH